MIKKIALVLVILAVGVLAYAATKPDTLHVERSASINAPAEKIFPLIDDFHSWKSWSPYEHLDPEMRRTYSNPARGNGAVYEWNGNNNVGQGRMEITESSQPARIRIKLDFIRPFEAHNVGQFALVPEGNSTKVTWSMDGESPYVAKVMGVFVDMDAMIGKDFETGLANLKTIAEK